MIPARQGFGRKGLPTDLRRAAYFNHLRDERRLDAVAELTALADDAKLPLRHMALAFAIAHPAVSSAIIGPRTMDHLEDLLAGADVTLTDDILDRIDDIVAPGTDIGTLDMAYQPPALLKPALRRRPRNQPATN
ncbi:MAG: aldo/keto reductase [Mycobacterium sp.]